jgi:hypothetical protein
LCPNFEGFSLGFPRPAVGQNFLVILAYLQTETHTFVLLKARGPLGPHHFEMER